MPAITYDGRSLMLDGRRRWLVGGVIDPSRVPAALWPHRLRAARQLGLNCIVVPVCWSECEQAPGRFDFSGDRDIAELLRQIHRRGMMAVLRIGPYIGDAHDMGGLPAWLLDQDDMTLRCAGPAFMEAVARYIGAVMTQVRDLQATSREGGPIVLIQTEHEWRCGDDAAGVAYLAEIDRYVRENGGAVPLINCNGLYQLIEGELDGWSGFDDLHAMARQLRSVRPEAPPIVAEFQLGRHDIWGQTRRSDLTPSNVLSRLAQAMAAGAQCFLAPFHGGVNFGFSTGRLPSRRDGFVTSGADRGAPLSETGVRTPLYDALKRLCTFASTFDRVFTGLDPEHQPVTLTPGAKHNARHTVIHARGSQGSIAWVFGDDGSGARRGVVTITLPDGSTLPVDLRGQPVAWCLLDALISPHATLDFCNLSAFATVGDVFVCFGPSKARAMVSINGALLEAVVPSGKSPLVQEHEGVRVVICSESQIDAAYATDDAVIFGVGGLKEDGSPLSHPRFRQALRLEAGGAAHKLSPPTPPASPRAVSLLDWSAAQAHDFVTGASDRFAVIEGPDSLDRLGTPHGYGWLRLRITSRSACTVHAGLFEASDRLHIYRDGKLDTLFGLGPGACDGVVELPLKKGVNTITMLLDNMGRSSAGGPLADRKGLYGHIWDVKPLRDLTIERTVGAPVDALGFRSPLWDVHLGDCTDTQRLTWSITHRRKTPLFLTIDEPPAELASRWRGLVIVNDEPIDWFEPGGWNRFTLGADQLRRGVNIVQLAVLGDAAPIAEALGTAVHLYEGAASLTDEAQWAFASWETPDESSFEKVDKSQMSRFAGAPTWWRCSFKPTDAQFTPLLDAVGLSKGQLFLNEHNVGRYFVSTASGQSVPPQRRHQIPLPWLNTASRNDLLIFDEHGASPKRCKLDFDSDAYTPRS